MNRKREWLQSVTALALLAISFFLFANHHFTGAPQLAVSVIAGAAGVALMVGLYGGDE